MPGKRLQNVSMVAPHAKKEVKSLPQRILQTKQKFFEFVGSFVDSGYPCLISLTH